MNKCFLIQKLRIQNLRCFSYKKTCRLEYKAAQKETQTAFGFELIVTV